MNIKVNSNNNNNNITKIMKKNKKQNLFLVYAKNGVCFRVLCGHVI